VSAYRTGYHDRGVSAFLGLFGEVLERLRIGHDCHLLFLIQSQPTTRSRITILLKRVVTQMKIHYITHHSARDNNAMQMRIHHKKVKKQLGTFTVRQYRRVGRHCRYAVRNNEQEDAET
jgi:hypothetical protein